MNESDNDVSQTRLGVKLRRGHKKVKTGCVDCRRRRVKCTEERPKCRACQRRGAECEYPFPEARSVSADPSPAQQSHATSPHQHVSPLPGLSSTTISSILKDHTNESTYGVRDMALLHHWTISTCHHIYKNSALSLTFQFEFPQIAFKHPFVMQALLGLTALHIAYLEPEQRLSHAAEASRYHNQSLQGFNEALKHADDETANELFAWSSLNLLYVFGVSGRLGEGLWDESEWGSRKDRILGLGWIPMLRGVQTVLSPSFYTLRGGPLRDLLSIQNWEDLDVEQTNHIEDQYFCQTRDVWKDLHDAQTYEDTLNVLRRCRLYSAQFSGLQAESPDGEIFNRSWQGAFLLVPFAPESYFTLLRQRQPPALILYAFYGALLHRFNNDSWFMEGWGYDIVEVVSDLLGSYWREWIAWPIEVVGLNNR